MRRSHSKSMHRLLKYKGDAQRAGVQHGTAEQGFTLVETLVAVFVLMVAIAGPLTLLRNSLATANASKDNVTAANLARDALQYVKGVRDTNLYTSTPWTQGLDACMSQDCQVDTTQEDSSDAFKAIGGANTGLLRYDSSSNTYNHAVGANSDYTRTVRIEPVNASSTEVSVTATVTWTRGGIPHTYTGTLHLHELIAELPALAPPSDPTSIPDCPFLPQNGRTILMLGIALPEPRDVWIGAYGATWPSGSPIPRNELGPYAVDLPAGTYTVRTYSFDGFIGRGNESAATQAHEQWDVRILGAGGTTLATVGPTTDLIDGVDIEDEVDIFQGVVLGSQGTQIHIVHDYTTPNPNWMNSVVPGCVAFDEAS